MVFVTIALISCNKKQRQIGDMAIDSRGQIVGTGLCSALDLTGCRSARHRRLCAEGAKTQTRAREILFLKAAPGSNGSRRSNQKQQERDIPSQRARRKDAGQSPGPPWWWGGWSAGRRGGCELRQLSAEPQLGSSWIQAQPRNPQVEEISRYMG